MPKIEEYVGRIVPTAAKVRVVRDTRRGVLAFADVELNRDFVVRDVKVVATPTGRIVCGPSRRIQVRCGGCHSRNPLGNHYCGHCGVRLAGENSILPEDPPRHPRTGDVITHWDIAFPTNNVTRLRIQELVLAEFGRAERGAVAMAKEVADV